MLKPRTLALRLLWLLPLAALVAACSPSAQTTSPVVADDTYQPGGWFCDTAQHIDTNRTICNPQLVVCTNGWAPGKCRPVMCAQAQANNAWGIANCGWVDKTVNSTIPVSSSTP